MWKVIITWGNGNDGLFSLVRQFCGSFNDAQGYASELQRKVRDRLPYSDNISFDIEDIQEAPCTKLN